MLSEYKVYADRFILSNMLEHGLYNGFTKCFIPSYTTSFKKYLALKDNTTNSFVKHTPICMQNFHSSKIPNNIEIAFVLFSE